MTRLEGKRALITGAAFTALLPLGRLGDPRDITAAFVYLASDEAGWVTGTTIPVDGGLTAGSRLGEDVHPGGGEDGIVAPHTLAYQGAAPGRSRGPR